MAEAETHQVGADELGSGQATATLLAELPGPHHELGGDFFRVGMAVSPWSFGPRTKGFPFGEDMPDGDQEFTSNGDDGLLLADAGGQLVKLSLPILGGADGGPGGFDHDPAQVTAALLGDAPTAFGLARVVDARPQAGIADELLVAGEARDGADGAQSLP